MAFDNRDKIDFGKERIPRLFRLIFIPTLLGMIADVAFILTDGIFVGNGIGPQGLASINLIAPTMMLLTGLGVMFGMGCGILAAIQMAKGNLKLARIYVTQVFLSSILLALLVVALFYADAERVLSILGVPPSLSDSAMEYFLWFVPTCFFIMISIVGSFIIRLDGDPLYSMYTTVVPAITNILLDWLFIFPFGWGLKGAALATDIGSLLGAAMTFHYMFFRRRTLGFYPLKFSRTSLCLWLRNTWYMVRVGFPGLVGEMAVSVMILAGNISFGTHLKDAGITAFSVICYIFPLVLNVYIAATAAAQPIMSFNYGTGNGKRVRGALWFSTAVSMVFSIIVIAAFFIFPEKIISIFLKAGSDAYEMAVYGLPLFALGFIPMAYNLSVICFLQSIERSTVSTLLTLLRGIVLVVIFFRWLPSLIGTGGLWVSIPVSESVTALFCTMALLWNRNTRQVS